MERVFTSGRLVCFMSASEVRGSNGLIVNVPRMFVLLWDECYDQPSLERVSWNVAKAALPSDYEFILKKVNEERSAQMDKAVRTQAA